MSAQDEITKRFFEHERWVKALDVGVEKGIGKALLRTMAKPDVRIALYRAIAQGNYDISPPHTTTIPKDTPGEYRTVYVNDHADRIILNITNDLLFELTPDKIHPACKSYISGTGCGKVVIEASQHMKAARSADEVMGWKGDLSKYFDSVPIEYIDCAFDMVEDRYGASALIAMLRRYYHNDEYVTTNGNIAHKFMSLRQGCAVSAWLADVLLYHIDEQLSALDGYYVRYCDDMLFIGPDHQRALELLTGELDKMGLSLNPSKVEQLTTQRWFTFLGFSVKGGLISLSPRRLKNFQHRIDNITLSAAEMKQSASRVSRFLYKGNGRYSWSNLVLPVINSASDINTLNAYVMDAVRAAHTGRRRIGGLGFNKRGRKGCIVRGKGRHVAANRAQTPAIIEGYRSLSCMRKAMKVSREAYETIVRQL